MTKKEFSKTLLNGWIIFSADKFKTYAKIINIWEDNRGANGCEYCADITDKNDFIKIVNQYGIETATNMYNDREKCRFYEIGSNFDFPSMVKDMDSVTNALIDDIAEDFCRYPETYKDVFSISGVLFDLYNNMED